jgi:hypothetical protein
VRVNATRLVLPIGSAGRSILPRVFSGRISTRTPSATRFSPRAATLKGARTGETGPIRENTDRATTGNP